MSTLPARAGLPDRIAAARARLEELARHPARLCWTLLVTLACAAAERPIWSYAHGLWASFQSFFLVNAQVDYGEGPLLNQEVLLYHGHNIYTLGNTPPFSFGNYPPVFPLVASLLMHLPAIGVSLLAGRLTSSLAIMGSGLVVGLIVLQTTRQVLPAVLAAGILFTFSQIHDWGPYNRVDSLALFWDCCTVFVALRYAGTRKAWWVLPFALLTVYTRQSNVDGPLAAFAYLLWRDWRRCLAIGAAFAAAVLAAFVGLQIWSHGAFYLDTVVFNENAWNWGTVVSNWAGWARGEGRIPLRLAIAGAAAGLFGRGRLIWPVWLGASIALFATIGKVGSSINYFFPMEAAVAAAAGIFVAQFRVWFRRAIFPLWPLELVLPAFLFMYVHGAAPAWVPTRLPLLQRLEQAAGPYTMSRSPTAGAARAASARWQQDARLRREGLAVPRPTLVTPGATRQMVSFLRGIPGPVLSLDFPRAEVVQAGKRMQWQPFEYGVAYQDGSWSPQAFVAAIDDRYYGAVLFQSFGRFASYDGGFAAPVEEAIVANYSPGTTIQGLQVWYPDGPPAAPRPPVLATPVPHPLADLAAAVGRLPSAVLHAAFRPRPIRRGNFLELPLGPDFNLAATALPGAPDGPGWNGAGAAFAAGSGFPHAGTLRVTVEGTTVPFNIPPSGPGRADAFAPRAATTIPIPAQPYRALWILGSAAGSPAPRLPLELHYADGATIAAGAPLDPWCAPAVLPPDYPAFWAARTVSASGTLAATTCGLFAVRIATDPGQTLSGVTVGASPGVRIVALSAERA